VPVNFQQALQQIRQMGEQAPWQQERLEELRQQANKLFVQYACELDTLEGLVEQASAANSSLRCAAPFRECLNHTESLPAVDCTYTLLAADGSQINPDRHAMVEFGAINVGAIRMRPGQGQAPQEVVQSRLMFHNDLFTASGNFLTDDLVALKRDLAERQVLVELARSEKSTVVALTDGPLELFREPKGMPEFAEELKKYQEVLEELADLNAAAAGYVDKPRGDLLVRLLELVLLQQRGQLNKAGEERPLRGVFDSILLRTLLKPGQRSAVFAIRSGSARSFQGRLSLHFFYLNVGRPGHPNLSRVEIPRWVAENETLLNLTHASLVAQAHHLGARPYPYVLHRAHEIAVISFDERQQLENMIVAELYRQGVPVDDRSNKQIAKNASATSTRSR
jgi:DNA-binding FadR family transcriptional regulator